MWTQRWWLHDCLATIHDAHLFERESTTRRESPDNRVLTSSEIVISKRLMKINTFKRLCNPWRHVVTWCESTCYSTDTSRNQTDVQSHIVFPKLWRKQLDIIEVRTYVKYHRKTYELTFVEIYSSFKLHSLTLNLQVSLSTNWYQFEHTYIKLQVSSKYLESVSSKSHDPRSIFQLNRESSGRIYKRQRMTKN